MPKIQLHLSLSYSLCVYVSLSHLHTNTPPKQTLLFRNYSINVNLQERKSTIKRVLLLIVITSLVIIIHIIACSLDTDHLFSDYIITGYKYNSLLFHYYYLCLGNIILFRKNKLHKTFEGEKHIWHKRHFR